MTERTDAQRKYCRDRHRRKRGLGDGSGRVCPECEGPVEGRVDRKFCSVRCQGRDGNRRWRAAHPEEVHARNVARHAANREENNAASRAWYAAHREYANARSKEYAKANPNIHVLYVHGITPAELHTLYEAQGGSCAICDTPAPERGPGCLHIDHDHITGERRGLICHPCNKALGAVEEHGATWVMRALVYLGDPPLPRMRRKESAS